jgi:DNA mismatch endonuclease, patch repair protein
MDKITPAQRSEVMSSVRSKNTQPELTVRRMVHGLGYHYQLHRRELPGQPDLVFRSRRKVIFIHGCFWHRHPDPGCRRVRTPASNVDYWQEKFAKNIQRDQEHIEALRSRGWDVLVIWECEIEKTDLLRKSIARFLESAPSVR